MAAAFSRTMLLDYKRVQFTPDVLPSDLTGFSIYRREEERFVYQPGSVFCNLLLADEINRTSPKTQSALLEVMEEGKVTVEGITRKVPEPFCVIATQNPSGSLGTQRLPEAQVDRFMISLSIGYPDFESELAMAKGITDRDRLDTLVPVIEKEQLLEIQKEVCGVYISEEVFRYIIELVRASRKIPWKIWSISRLLSCIRFRAIPCTPERLECFPGMKIRWNISCFREKRVLPAFCFRSGTDVPALRHTGQICHRLRPVTF